MNFKDLREASNIGQPKRAQQLSVNSRVQSYGLNGKQGGSAGGNFNSLPYG